MERGLADRVLGLWEEDWRYSAVKALADAVEDQERRLRDLEDYVLRPVPVTPGPPEGGQS